VVYVYVYVYVDVDVDGRLPRRARIGVKIGP
jgi:hypothetical protein